MRFKQRRCRACGEGTIRLEARPGRRTRYKQFAHLDVPATLAIPTCEGCGAEWHNDTTAAAFDQAMERAYRDALRLLVQRAIETVTQQIEQRALERLLGLSDGYISKLKRGERDPSADLVAHLASIARNPKKHLRELEETWEHALDEPRR